MLTFSSVKPLSGNLLFHKELHRKQCLAIVKGILKSTSLKVSLMTCLRKNKTNQFF